MSSCEAQLKNRIVKCQKKAFNSLLIKLLKYIHLHQTTPTYISYQKQVLKIPKYVIELKQKLEKLHWILQPLYADLKVCFHHQQPTTCLTVVDKTYFMNLICFLE